jgi:hypothetical protein
MAGDMKSYAFILKTQVAVFVRRRCFLNSAILRVIYVLLRTIRK